MVIAKIKLAPGNVGWYDYTTGIHLTIANPIAEVKNGMNLERIRIGLSCKTIELLSGSLKEEDIIETIEATTKQAKVDNTSPSKEEVKVETEENAKKETEEGAKKTSGRKKKEDKK